MWKTYAQTFSPVVPLPGMYLTEAHTIQRFVSEGGHGNVSGEDKAQHGHTHHVTFRGAHCWEVTGSVVLWPCSERGQLRGDSTVHHQLKTRGASRWAHGETLETVNRGYFLNGRGGLEILIVCSYFILCVF